MKKLKHYLLLFLDLFRPAPTIIMQRRARVRERQQDGTVIERDATPEEREQMTETCRKMRETFRTLREGGFHIDTDVVSAAKKGDDKLWQEVDKVFDEMDKALEGSKK